MLYFDAWGIVLFENGVLKGESSSFSLTHLPWSEGYVAFIEDTTVA